MARKGMKEKVLALHAKGMHPKDIARELDANWGYVRATINRDRPSSTACRVYEHLMSDAEERAERRKQREANRQRQAAELAARRAELLKQSAR